MTLRDFVEKSRREFRREGVTALSDICKDFSASAVAKLPYLNRIGTNVYHEDWDVLLILDACRLDLYRETIREDVGDIWSVGSSSEEWMRNTFANRDTGGTAYVTGNIFSRDYLNPDDFYELEQVWEYGWDDDIGSIPPRPITNEAIRIWRKLDPERMIVHYMQPHFPAIGSKIDVGGQIEKAEFGAPGRDFWLTLRRGDISVEDAWQAYRDNLEYVFEDVKIVMNNVDGTVAVSADHGNAFGEWGTYGHPAGLQIPSLRRVPWDSYTCTDKNTYTPEQLEKGEATPQEVKKRLGDLGYL